MMREAFSMRLRPGAQEEYRRRHEAAWPELLRAIQSAGVQTFTIYGADDTVVVVSDVSDPDAWPRARATEIHARWVAQLAPLMQLDREGAAKTQRLVEIFHLERQ